MRTDKLQTWALAAEIVGGIAVVVSLAFVGLQVRQSSVESNLNTRAIEANSYQDLNSQIAAVSFEIMTNPEFAYLADKIYSNQVPAEEPLDRQVVAFFTYTSLHADTAFNQYKSGIISEDKLQSVLFPLRAQLNTDAGKLDWSQRSDRKTDFHKYIEEHMRDRYPSDPYWKNE
ncbi:MAG: hypothetical protein R3F41_11945 [Gammaproteobacteria bacterium]